jgi:hypothetical protein
MLDQVDLMSTIVVESDCVRIPAWVNTLEAFRQWAESKEFPDKGRICYLQDDVWVDMTKEQLFTHIQVKDQYTIVLGGLVQTNQSGFYFSDGLRLTNLRAGISGKADGTFVSLASLRAGRARLVEGAEGGYVELEGIADMTLEVVSQSSVEKDTITLVDAYWEAGIQEYWLVDARDEVPQFDILRHTSKGYVPARKQSGWVKSNVFGRSFRLTRKTGSLGYPEFRLEVR